jgi:hypothetical protein
MLAAGLLVAQRKVEGKVASWHASRLVANSACIATEAQAQGTTPKLNITVRCNMSMQHTTHECIVKHLFLCSELTYWLLSASGQLAIM